MKHTIQPDAISLWQQIKNADLELSKPTAHDHLNILLSILFPGILGSKAPTQSTFNSFVATQTKILRAGLQKQIHQLIQFQSTLNNTTTTSHLAAKAATQHLLNQIPHIREVLFTDIEAAYEGDPAASSLHEVLLSYPGILAIATHRIAHELYLQKVPILPRLFSEWAHSQTGIDIHPGARIGPSFFIDHGTGVVIGETSVIGTGVKLYQGVTLGALSFAKDANGRLIKGNKRHPNIEDGVIIYSGATVLGGDTTIGHHSVIGGNCWVTSSVAPNTLVNTEHSRKKKILSVKKEK